MRKYDTDGKTRIKLNIRMSDPCPKCGRKHTLKYINKVEVRCLACDAHIQRWVKI